MEDTVEEVDWLVEEVDELASELDILAASFSATLFVIFLIPNPNPNPNAISPAKIAAAVIPRCQSGFGVALTAFESSKGSFERFDAGATSPMVSSSSS